MDRLINQVGSGVLRAASQPEWVQHLFRLHMTTFKKHYPIKNP